MSKKILLLPGWMSNLKLYNNSGDIIIQIGRLDESSKNADYTIGLSLGSLAALKEWDKNGKLILVNPPIPKRNIFVWFNRWIKFVSSEGLFLERQKFTSNLFKLIYEIIKGAKLLKIDFSEIINGISNEKIVMIKGKDDNFFCDNKAAEFMKLKNIQVIKVPNCGHNWCEKIEKTVYSLIC